MKIIKNPKLITTIKGPEIVEVRRLGLKRAMEEILDLFKKRKRLFYSDIVEDLRLDYETVIKACNRLEHEGLIKGDANEKKDNLKIYRRGKTGVASLQNLTR